jgi:type IV pilus assembly protein PilY1
MGEYAQLLRSPSNPIGESIKTATAGIGSAFNVFSTTTQDITVDGNSVTVADCSASSSTDAQNLCKLGELKTNAATAYGNGKFYPIAIDIDDLNQINEDREDKDQLTESQYYAIQLKNSIADFASGLAGISSATPAGTITVPDNPYQASEQLPYAYLPMLQPNISSNASIWKGNLKKYQLNSGTLYGNSDKGLYSNVAGDLEKTAQDIWQSSDFRPADTLTVDNSSIKAGGIYAQLTTPQSGVGSVRTVYVEDITSTKDSTPILRKLSVDAEGKLTGFKYLKDATYTEQNKRRILSFLGFESYIKDGDAKPLLDINGDKPSDDNELAINMVLKKPTEAFKVLGGVVHSKPTAISYSANLDKHGRITSTREDYAIFGSMDGALHMVKDADGTEQFAIIPKKMIADQSIALVDDSTKGAVGQPYFGIDAPWLVTTDYDYDLKRKKVTIDESSGQGMFAYGGLRMGGEGLYGMDITTKSAPEILFTITPRETFTDLTDPTTPVTTTTGTAGFERLGQIWSKPTAAKIRMTKDAAPIDVLVFGGGYDMQYESDSYVATSDKPAKGNAIYIINAQSGELIWSTSGEATAGKNTKTDNMIHSITGGITVLDRDNDGLMDHLYAADLGGQVFRSDFENARPAKFGFTAVDNFSNKRITRVLNTASTDAKPYRFYERPVVSFYRNEGTGTNNGKIFALVNIISGNRSAPLSKLRDEDGDANRVYGIIDTDITDIDLFKDNFELSIEDLTESGHLVNLVSTLGDRPSSGDKVDAKAAMIVGTKHGWYYPLTRFDGYNNVRYNKGVGDSVVINSILYTTVYNPDKMYSTPQSCVASILGGSERQLYCLPYGICMDENSISGTGGYVPAGQGIQELTLGAYDKDNTDIKVLVGTRTITDRINADNRIEYNAGNTNGKYYDEETQSLKNFSEIGSKNGGDGSAVEYLFNERYTLQPKAWYERQ